jgi:hypothetical protein
MKTDVITEDNVLLLAERVAYGALKQALVLTGNKIRWVLLKNLEMDWRNKHNPRYVFSSAYDLVQIAVMVFYEHIGKQLDTVVSLSKRNKPLTVLDVCYRTVYKEIYAFVKENKAVELNESLVSRKSTYINNTNAEETLQNIITALELTPKQNEVLTARLDGQGYTIIGQNLNNKPSDILGFCVAIQKKYKKYLMNNNLNLIQCSKCKRIIGILDYVPNEDCCCKKCQR